MATLGNRVNRNPVPRETKLQQYEWRLCPRRHSIRQSIRIQISWNDPFTLHAQLSVNVDVRQTVDRDARNRVDVDDLLLAIGRAGPVPVVEETVETRA